MFAPRLCDAQQCASSHITFGILNMLVVVRSAPYLYLRIEGDPWIELYIACDIIYIFARSSPGTKYITNYNSLRTYLHFRCSIQNIILKPTDTATGTSHIRTILASINHVISGTIVLGADSDLPDTIAIGNHHVPKLYGLPLLMPLCNKD